MKLSTKLLAAALTLMMVVALAVPALAATLTHTEITAEDKYYDGTAIDVTAAVTLTVDGEPVDESSGTIKWFYAKANTETWAEGLPTEIGSYKVQATFIPLGDSGLEPSTSNIVTATIYDPNAKFYDILVKTDKEDRIYEAYHIFGGDVADVTELDPSGTEEIVRRYLANIVWGDAFDEAAQKALSTWYFNNMDFENEDAPEIYDAKVIAEALIKNFSGKEIAAIFANYMGAPQATADSGDFDVVAPGYTLRVTKPGYYLVREQKDSLDGEHASATWFLLSTLDPENVTILEPKVPTDPETDKFVSNTLDEITTPDWNDKLVSANVNENVYFRLDATFPFNSVDETGWTVREFEDYEVYSFTFHDTLPAGMTFGNNVKVYTNCYFDEEVDPSLYTVTATKNADGTTTILVHFDDLTEVKGKAASDTGNDPQFPVVLSGLNVIYTAKVNVATSEIGESLVNRVYATYPNDPNHPDEEDGETPPSDAEVVTYDIKILKVDGDTGEALKGAGFALYKLVDGRKMYHSVVPFMSGEQSYVKFEFNQANAQIYTTNENGEVVISGLEAGTYYLEEYFAPTGYNKLEGPVEVVITESDDALQTVEVTVENEKGLVLPSTGGMGTTLLYALGAILLIGSGVVVIARRRVAE